MTDTISLTKEELESIYEQVNQQIDVLSEEKNKLDDALARLVRNREVFASLIELKQIKEEQTEMKKTVV